MPRLLLVRHARAGARGDGPDDLARALDERGRAQAAALPALLVPLLGPEAAVHSSPARRCRETVEPLAATLGKVVTIEDGLIEGADARVLLDRLATLTVPTVWSSHGDVIPGLLALLGRRGLDLGADPSCRKGSTWVIEVEDGAARSARSLPPPG
jgi:broad specificity phosphatase PhoE